MDHSEKVFAALLLTGLVAIVLYRMKADPASVTAATPDTVFTPQPLGPINLTSNMRPWWIAPPAMMTLPSVSAGVTVSGISGGCPGGC